MNSSASKLQILFIVHLILMLIIAVISTLTFTAYWDIGIIFTAMSFVFLIVLLIVGYFEGIITFAHRTIRYVFPISCLVTIFLCVLVLPPLAAHVIGIALTNALIANLLGMWISKHEELNQAL